MDDAADLILHNGRITTLDRQNPEAQAVAVRAGRFIAVGVDQDVMRHAGSTTQRVDLRGRRVIPGLIDSHMHIIRGGLNYNMELRWDGVRSLADAMRSAGFLAWSCATSSTSHSGISGFSSRIGRGSSSHRRFKSSIGLLARNGARPVHIAYSTLPRLNRSLR